jgi:hypothetical protein
VSGSAGVIENQDETYYTSSTSQKAGILRENRTSRALKRGVYSRNGFLIDIFVILLAVLNDSPCLVFRTFRQRELPRVAPQNQNEVVLSQEKKTEQAPYHPIKY